MSERALFRKYPIFAVQQHQEQRAKEAVRALPQERLGEDEEKLATEIAASLTMELPVLDPSQIYQPFPANTGRWHRDNNSHSLQGRSIYVRRLPIASQFESATRRNRPDEQRDLAHIPNCR
jgi:hypothetical protein